MGRIYFTFQLTITVNLSIEAAFLLDYSNFAAFLLEYSNLG